MVGRLIARLIDGCRWKLASDEVRITGDDLDIGPLEHGNVTITRTVRTVTTSHGEENDHEMLFKQ